LNVFDFDHTIYAGDSTKDFYMYCLRKRVSLARYWPVQAWAFLRYGVKVIDKTRCKEIFYRFFRGLRDTGGFVNDFWDAHIDRIKPFYMELKRADDLIISASPDFLLREACSRLGIAGLIASVVDPDTGQYMGVNCYGDEKVRRFREECPDSVIDTFYSDSLSDAPLAAIARISFIVRGDKLLPWEDFQ